VLPPNVTVSMISPIMETEMIATTLWILECLFFVHNGEKRWEDNRKFELYFEFNRRASIGLDSSRVLSKAPTAPAWPSCRRNTACKCNQKQEKVLGAAFIRFSAGNLANDQFITLSDKSIAWLQPWLVSRWHWYNAKIVRCQDRLYLI